MDKGWLYRKINGDLVGDGKEITVPSTRKALFFDIIKLRFWTIVSQSLLAFVFFVPLIMWLLIWSAYINYADPSLTDASETFLAQRNFWLNFIKYVVSIPLITMASLGLAGSLALSKKLTWGEGIFLLSDFFEGIRQGWREALLGSLAIGLALLSFTTNYFFFPLVSDVPLFIRASILTVIGIAIVAALSFTLFLMASQPIYRFKFKQTLKNNAMFSLLLLPQNIAVLALGFTPIFCGFLIPSLLIHIIWALLIGVVGIGLFSLLWTLYAQRIFDRFINSVYQKDIVAKGLAK